MLIYKTLFEVQVYHDYFLDNGAEKFDSLDPAEQLAQLGRYNLPDFLEVYPTAATATLLRNQRMRMIMQNDGFKVVVSTQPGAATTPVIPISADPLVPVTMEFCIRIKDGYFNNYTDLAFEMNRIYLFTNREPPLNIGFPLIPVMSYVTPDSDLIGNTYLASEELTADVLEKLSVDDRMNVMGMFSITLLPEVETEPNKYAVITADGLIRNPNERFRIHFKNRKRFWKYKKQNGDVFQTTEEQPLVKYGFVELDPATDFEPPQTPVTDQNYPNAGVMSFEKAIVEGEEVIYSVIFI